MSLMDKIILRAQQNRQRIVLPESLEERTLTAADHALADGLADIILIGNEQEIFALADKLNLKHVDKATIIDPANSPKTEEYAQLLFQLRQKKGMTIEEARRKVMDPLYFGCLIIKSGDADGQISGALGRYSAPCPADHQVRTRYLLRERCHAAPHTGSRVW